MDSHVENLPAYVPVEARAEVFNLQKVAMSLREETTQEMVEQDLRVQEARRQGEVMMEHAEAILDENVVNDGHLSKSATMDSLSHAHTAEYHPSTTPDAMEQEQELEHLEVDEQRSSEDHFEDSPHPFEETAMEQPAPNFEEESQQAEATAAVPEAALEPVVKQIEILPLLDITGELRFVKERQTFLAKEGRPHGDTEWTALHELEQSTLALVSSRKALSEKQRQLAQLDAGDKRSVAMHSEVFQLTTESKQKEHQWSAIKEAYYHDFVIAAIKAAAAQAVEAHEALKASVEHDIKLLRTQIATLQKQLDTVAQRRKQMLSDADEQIRIMRGEH